MNIEVEVLDVKRLEKKCSVFSWQQPYKCLWGKHNSIHKVKCDGIFGLHNNNRQNTFIVYLTLH